MNHTLIRKELAEKLTLPFSQVRLDLFNIDGKIYFGEMTFTSLEGMMNYFTPEFLLQMGEKADISHLNNTTLYLLFVSE